MQCTSRKEDLRDKKWNGMINAERVDTDVTCHAIAAGAVWFLPPQIHHSHSSLPQVPMQNNTCVRLHTTLWLPFTIYAAFSAWNGFCYRTNTV